MDRIVKSNGTEIECQPDARNSYTLQRLQEIVGGYIEFEYSANSGVMEVNEEGMLLGLPINAKATEWFRQNATGYNKGFIYGDVLITTNDKI